MSFVSGMRPIERSTRPSTAPISRTVWGSTRRQRGVPRVAQPNLGFPVPAQEAKSHCSLHERGRLDGVVHAGCRRRDFLGEGEHLNGIVSPPRGVSPSKRRRQVGTTRIALEVRWPQSCTGQ